MTRTSPETSDEFHALLESAIRAADANGVDIEGAYAFLTDDERPNWELQIVRVADQTRLAEQ